MVAAVAIHLWTAWIAWTAKGLFAALFTLTVPFLAELVWGAWLSWKVGTLWHPYAQVLAGYLAVAVMYRLWRPRKTGSDEPNASRRAPPNPESGQG